MSKSIFVLVPLFLALASLPPFSQTAAAQPWKQAASYGGGGIDVGAAGRVAKDGDRYVTGSFSTVASFGGNTLASAGGSDIFLARYARDGQLLWVVQSGGKRDDAANDLALDDASNIYVTGWFVGTASFGSVNGGPTMVTGSDESIFVAKYSVEGNLLWLQTGIISGPFPGIVRGHGIALNDDANTLYVTGVAQGDTAFSSSDGTTQTVPGTSTWHMFLVKYDLSGKFDWGEVNAAAPNSIPRSVAVDSENDAYVAGWFEGGATFSSHDGSDHTITGRSGPVQSAPDYPGDAFIAKYDSDGNLQWVNDIGGYKAIATYIAAGRDGRIAVTGFIGNRNTVVYPADTVLTSQPGGTSINLGGGNYTTPYNRDVFIATYNSAGVLMNASRLGSEGQDAASWIGFGRRGHLYVAGVFSGTFPVGKEVLTGTETSNLFVLNYTPRRLAWAKAADGAGTQSFEQNPTLSLGRHGRVLVTGTFTNTAQFDSTTLQSTGAEDIFVAELK